MNTVPIMLTDLRGNLVYVNGTSIQLARFIPFDQNQDHLPPRTVVYFLGSNTTVEVKEEPQQIIDMINKQDTEDE